MTATDDITWKTVTENVSYGSRTIGVKIQVFVDNGHGPAFEIRDNDDQLSEVVSLIYQKEHEIRDAITKDLDRRDPTIQNRVKAELAELQLLFPETPIFVEDIANEYDSDSPRRWLIVTSRIGRIKLGWRKRVINIDWEDSIVKATADELFHEEQVTKEDHFIHAWNYPKAKQYLEKIFNQAAV